MSLMTITQNITLVNVTNESQPTFLSWLKNVLAIYTNLPKGLLDAEAVHVY